MTCQCLMDDKSNLRDQLSDSLGTNGTRGNIDEDDILINGLIRADMPQKFLSRCGRNRHKDDLVDILLDVGVFEDLLKRHHGLPE
jgi:hypothetical protein